MRVLLSSAGRRVELFRAFEAALDALDSSASVLAVDVDPTSPVVQLAGDAGWTVPRCDDPAFPETMLDLCERESVDVLVPTIDTELAVYAAHREAFAAVGTTVSVSDPATIAITADKVETNAFFRRIDIPTVEQACTDQPQDVAGWSIFPAIVKPRAGSSAKGVFRVADRGELDAALALSTGSTIIETAVGAEPATTEEYTINAFVGRGGACLAEVPHRRIRVRDGEVNRGVTAREPRLMEPVRRMVEALPGAYGALCAQAIWDRASDDIRFFEINARFGGGSPLAIASGAPFAEWLLREAAGESLSDRAEDWQEGLHMLRFDQSTFASRTEIDATRGWTRS